MTYPTQDPQYAAPQPQPQPQAYGTNYAPPMPVSKPEPPLDQPWYEADFMGAFKRFWKKYATFSGRASRAEFWWAYLANFLVAIILGLLCLVFIGLVLLPLYALAIIIPNLAIAVRRLHDSNLPGWWLAVIYGGSFVGGLLTGAGTSLSVVDSIDCYNYDPYYEDYVYSCADAGVSGGSIALWVIGGLISLAAMAAFIYFMVRPTDPKGARFDAPAVPQAYGMAPNYAAAGQQAAPAYPADAYTQAAPAPAPEANLAPEADSTRVSVWQPESTPSAEPAVPAEPVVTPDPLATPTNNVALPADEPTIDANAEAPEGSNNSPFSPPPLPGA